MPYHPLVGQARTFSDFPMPSGSFQPLANPDRRLQWGRRTTSVAQPDGLRKLSWPGQWLLLRQLRPVGRSRALDVHVDASVIHGYGKDDILGVTMLASPSRVWPSHGALPTLCQPSGRTRMASMQSETIRAMAVTTVLWRHEDVLIPIGSARPTAGSSHLCKVAVSAHFVARAGSRHQLALV